MDAKSEAKRIVRNLGMESKTISLAIEQALHRTRQEAIKTCKPFMRHRPACDVYKEVNKCDCGYEEISQKLRDLSAKEKS